MATPRSSATTVPRGPARSRPWRLRGRTRKTLLVAHIAAAGAWLGLDLVMGILVLTAVLSDDPATAATAFRALEMFAVWPLLVAGLVCLASGVLLGLGSKYGLVRFWWVAVKLALNVVLTSLVVVALRPTVLDAADRARTWLAGGPADLGVGDLAFPPVVSTVAVLFAMVLSVFKPWGRISRRTSGDVHEEPSGDGRAPRVGAGAWTS